MNLIHFNKFESFVLCFSRWCESKIMKLISIFHDDKPPSPSVSSVINLGVVDNVLVVGGGRSGLGRYLAIEMCETGHFVCATSSSLSGPDYSGNLNIIQCDLTNSTNVITLADQISNGTFLPRYLVWCGGALSPTELVNGTTVENFDRYNKAITINLTSSLVILSAWLKEVNQHRTKSFALLHISCRSMLKSNTNIESVRHMIKTAQLDFLREWTKKENRNPHFCCSVSFLGSIWDDTTKNFAEWIRKQLAHEIIEQFIKNKSLWREFIATSDKHVENYRM